MTGKKTRAEVESKKTGPQESRLKLDGIDWKDALKQAVQKKRPKVGWPDKKKAK